MGTVLGVLAFFMALGAIWFTTEALKRMDVYGTALVTPFVKQMELSLSEARAQTLVLDQRLIELERKVGILRMEHRAAPQIPGDTKAIGQGIDEAQRFTPTNVYNA
jgi:hypothetical protein